MTNNRYVSPCATTHAPAVAAVSTLIENKDIFTDERFSDIVARCPADQNTSRKAAEQQILKEVDDKLLCEVMCCCTKNPSMSRKGRNQKQQCVDDTLYEADRSLGYQSRYKSEVSYDMTEEKPVPFMHRESGQNTTQRSTHWQTRAKNEIDEYKSGKGLVRRPDVVIVKNPQKPPYQENIERVIEMKFLGDDFGYEQRVAYQDIAGAKNKLSLIDEKGCNCSSDDQHRQEQEMLGPFLAPNPEKEQEKNIDWGAVGETVGMGVVTALGVVATAALLLSPFEGPAGEVAAGTGTAAAAARTAAAFGRIFKLAPVAP